MDQTANLLGALAIAVGDRQRTAVEAVADNETSAAALSALYHFLEAPSLDLLRQVVGLTHSGTVRLVDRLESQGLLKRGPGTDGRSASVLLTAAGRRAARAVTAARATALSQVLESLPADDQVQLNSLLGTMLAGLVRGPGATRWTCRLCDTSGCGRAEDRCPVANAAEARYGPLS